MTSRFSSVSPTGSCLSGPPAPRAYLDCAATAPLSPAARNAMAPWLGEQFGNASSVHVSGRRARMALEEARELVAGSIGATPQEIFFTSGATEADNLGLIGAARAAARDRGRRHLVVSGLEHPAVRRPAEALVREGFELSVVAPDAQGIVATDHLAAHLRSDTALIALMAVNNEIGTCQPVREAATLAHSVGAFLLCDAVQAPGNVFVDVRSWDVDMAAFTGHKLGGPPGAGFLYCRSGIDLVPLLYGGEQENQRRAGTENIPGLVGMAAALHESVSRLGERVLQLEAILDRVRALSMGLSDCRVLGHPEKRAPHMVSLLFERADAEALLLALDMAGVAASSGSACSSHTLEPSPVLLAMGLDEEAARSVVRFSWGCQTTSQEIHFLGEVLPGCVERSREVFAARRAR